MHFPRGEGVVCERPAPHPALAVRGPGVTSSSFRPQGAGYALETARLAGGVYLQIRHESCLKSSQAFRFHLPKAEVLGEEPSAAYARAAALFDALAPAGGAGAPLHGLSVVLSVNAAKGATAPPLGTRIQLDEFQELLVNRQAAHPASAYGEVLTVLYRLRL